MQGNALASAFGAPYIVAVTTSTTEWDPATTTLVTLLAQTARGPRREGIFALWLTLRIAQDLLREPAPAERAHRRRLTALEKRITSLTMPPPLRRALGTAIGQLREADAAMLPIILSQLVAPTRDALGADAAEAVALVVRAARNRTS